jgi:hypothetical protein
MSTGLALLIIACATLLLWALDNDRRVDEARTDKRPGGRR